MIGISAERRIVMKENNNIENETFSYTYSAKQQDELKKIRKKYLPPEEDKMEQLRRLDKSVTTKGTIVAVIVGVISALILGFGMSCVMVWGNELFIVGVVVGIIGLIGVGLAYPLYTHITQKERKRLAPQILKLSEELLK